MKRLIFLSIIFYASYSYSDNSKINPLDFTGVEFETEKHFNFNQFKGKIIYIDFWASWCAPCLESLPFMEQLYNKNSTNGFEIIAINIDENKSDAYKFLQEHPISFLNLYDPNGLIGKKFKVKNMPTAFLVDKDGHILFKHEGFNQQYAKKLEQSVLLHINK